MVARLLVVAMTGLVLVGCSKGTSSSTNARPPGHARLIVDGKPSHICVAIARTAREQETGLMNVRALPKNEGMAFVLSGTPNVSFWMKDTFVPLVVVWVADGGAVLGAADMAPQDLTPHPTPGPVALGIELSPGDWAPFRDRAKTIELGADCQARITARGGGPSTRF